MPIYTAKMKHSEATIIRLAETRYNTFQFGKKLIRLGLALVLIMIGLYLGGDNITPWICLFVGCVLITGLNTRPRSEGRKIFQQLNGKSLESQYSFFEDGFKFYDDGELIPYKKLIRLVEDKEYLYQRYLLYLQNCLILQRAALLLTFRLYSINFESFPKT